MSITLKSVLQIITCLRSLLKMVPVYVIVAFRFHQLELNIEDFGLDMWTQPDCAVYCT